MSKLYSNNNNNTKHTYTEKMLKMMETKISYTAHQGGHRFLGLDWPKSSFITNIAAFSFLPDSTLTKVDDHDQKIAVQDFSLNRSRRGNSFINFDCFENTSTFKPRKQTLAESELVVVA